MIPQRADRLPSAAILAGAHRVGAVVFAATVAPILLPALAAQESGSPPHALRDGERRTAVLPDSGAHRWTVRLDTGTYVRVEIVQLGIDLVVEVLEPAGEQRLRVDSPTGSEGTETARWIAHRAGPWIVRVSRLSAGAGGSYEIELAQRRPATTRDRKLVAADSLSRLADERHGRGESAAADSLYRRVLELREEAVGPEHPETAAAINALAVLAYGEGRYPEAARLMRRALRIREAALGPLHPEVASSLNNLAAIYRSLGRYEDAESLYRRAIEAREDAVGADDVSLAAPVENLGVLYWTIGRYDEAIDLIRRALQLQKRAHGPDHPRVANALHNLATLHWTQGRYSEAEPLLRRALAIRQRATGATPRDVATTLNNLAVLLAEQGRFSEAEPLYSRALELRRETLGPDHPDVAQSLNNLGWLYDWQGRHEKARAHYERALAIRRAALGPGHPEVATVLGNLGTLHADEGRYADAERLYRQALEIQEEAVGQNHPDVATTLSNLANLMADIGHLEEAGQVYLRALEIRESALGEKHPDVANTLTNLAVLRGREGEYRTAERLLRRSLAIREESLGPDNPEVANTLSNLAGLLADTDRHARADTLLRRAASIWEAAFGSHHPALGHTLSQQAVVHHALGRPQEARRAIDRAIQILDGTTTLPVVRIGAYALRARLRREAGDRAGSLEDMEEALRSLEELRPRVGGTEATRAGFFGDYATYYDRMVSWLVADRQPERALEYAERGRARVLLDQLAAGRVDLRASIPDGERRRLEAAERDAEARLSEFHQRINILRGRRDLADSVRLQRIAALEDSLRGAEDEYRRIYREIRNASPLWRDLITTGGAPVALSTVRRSLLGREEVMLLYQIGADRSWLFVVPPAGPDSLQVFPLEVSPELASELEVRRGSLTSRTLGAVLGGGDGGGGPGASSVIAQLGTRRGLGGGRVNAGVARLHALFRVLVPAAVWETLRDAAEVVLVPDDRLHQLPFEALVVEMTGGDTSPRYWLDEGPPVRYAPSATSLYSISRRPGLRARGSAGAPVLSLSDPVYDPRHAGRETGAGREADTLTDRASRPDSVGGPGVVDLDTPPSDVTRNRYERTGGSLIPLPGTARETRAIREAFGPDRSLGRVDELQGLSATEPNFRDAAVGKRYLHLATHGLVDQDRGSLFAALALTPPATETASPENDGFLQLHEIYELRLPELELAVLSACESNVGDAVEGEGVFALSRGFLAAGARRVVASQWAVDDASTAALMGEFFRAVAVAEQEGRRVDYAGALRRAKRAVRARPEWSDPYHWAPFILTGVR